MTATADAIDWIDLERVVDPRSVLIVDDDHTMSEEIAEALGELGFVCFLASSSEEAEAIAAGNPQIDLVITRLLLARLRRLFGDWARAGPAAPDTGAVAAARLHHDQRRS